MSEQSYDVASADEVKDGTMRAVKAGETEVLLVRANGAFHALPAHCTHYGAPLADGVLSGTRIVCPWHHACFDATNGDLLEPPALDALPSFAVRVDDGRVLVTLPDEPSDRRTPDMVDADPDDARTFAIVGGGGAGYAAAQALREDRYRGRIVMISADAALPVDRPNLSKDYLNGHAEAEWIPLRPEAFYAEHGVETALGRRVTSLDVAARAVTFEDGERTVYDAILIATGGIPKRPELPGVDLDGVFTLRSLGDADSVIAAIGSSKRAVVVGASFIAMEAAASLVERELSVTVVAPDEIPFARTLGPEIGRMLKNLHEKKGVEFRLGRTVERFEGEKAVTSVVLDDGTRLEADFVVVGAGVRPATSFVEGVDLEKDGGIPVDEHLRVADGVWAAGDVASFRDPRSGERGRIEHWRTALQQGRVAAHNMAGRTSTYEAVPFFWTNQYGEGVSYVGHAHSWDEILVDGDVEKRDFLALYVKDGAVLAAAASGRDHEVAAISELMRLGKMPAAEELRGGFVDWAAGVEGD